MTKYQKTAEILGLSDSEPLPQLQDLVMAVKGCVDGSSESLSSEYLFQIELVLHYRITHWDKSMDIIDGAIYIMCLEGLRLARQELAKRKSREKLS